MERKIQLLQLKDFGVDTAGALERFMGNEELFFRFLHKFTEDTNIIKLKEAIENGNRQEAFNASHTLKGLTGNLSLVKLSGLFSSQVEFLRGEQWEQATALMPEIEAQYEAFCNMLTE